MTDARESEAAARVRDASGVTTGARGTPVAAARLARALYLAGLPLREITAQTGLTPGRVHYWADREIAADGSVTLSPHPRRRPRAVDIVAPSPRRRQALAHRLWRAAERQVGEIEARLAALSARAAPARGSKSGGSKSSGSGNCGSRNCGSSAVDTSSGGSPSDAPSPVRSPAVAPGAGDAERDARALAVLARVLRELTALDAAEAKRRAGPLPGEEEAGPYDLDTFRRELARRLDDLRGTGEDPAAP